MKIVSFNICRCRYSGIEEICEYINSLKADILFIQEVDRFCERSDYIDQYEKIKNLCYFDFSFFNRTLFLNNSEEYGTALYMKKDYGEISTYNISCYNDSEPRIAINLNFYGSNHNVIFVHLSKFTDYACNQLKVIISSHLYTEKSIIAGDFNFSSDILEKTFSIYEKDKSLTWPAKDLSVRIDHFFDANNILLKQETYDSMSLSDHLAIGGYFSI